MNEQTELVPVEVFRTWPFAEELVEHYCPVCGKPAEGASWHVNCPGN